MSDPQALMSDPVNASSHEPRSVPVQLDENAVVSPDTSLNMTGKAQTIGRASRPPNLTWDQMPPVNKDHYEDDHATRAGNLNNGPVSPVSPIGSEVLRTPNISDRSKHTYKHPSSPGTTSPLPPRLHSPASQIFERSVQEDILPSQASPSIPAHIRTENYIPPVLEASSAAITDEQLDPDSVEIVTHSLHHPAAAGVTPGSTADQSLASSGVVDQFHTQSTDAEEVSSTYGALDTNDVRRLSFISFADVVNAEHAETGESGYGREPSQVIPAAGSFFAGHNRSPSPLRSPASSHALGTSPPTSIATSFKEMSPNHGPRAPGSPFAIAHSPVSSSFGGELNVETMGQALRRTGSGGDLGGVASQTASAFGNDEPIDRSF